MKLALFSDVHANLHALEACLAHAETQQVHQQVYLGDLVGYGAHPAEVLDLVMEQAERGAIVVQGNHDAMAVAPPPTVAQVGETTAAWTHAQLDMHHHTFLRTRPLIATQGACFFVHASADAPGRWRYVEDERAAQASLEAAMIKPEIRYVFGGHVHQQTLFYQGNGRNLMRFAPTAGVPIPTPAHRRWIATVGSVGQPRDGRPLAMYALFDTTLSRLTFHRVPYDHEAAAAAVRQAGLPEFFARRLEEGR
jgi:diadenosine tetraphosphatase ApaH/serine/threonine PP2A family protein phosphatase